MPINCPYRARVANYQRDGRVYNGNQGSAVNHEPNTQGGPTQDPSYAWSQDQINALTGRYPLAHPNTYFEQPRTLWNKVFSETDRQHWIQNMAGPLGSVKKRETKENMLALFYKVDPNLGTRLSQAIGVPLNKAKL